jgi:hypothetical protein
LLKNFFLAPNVWLPYFRTISHWKY